MSSATSIDPPARGTKAAAAPVDDPGLRPWQFFVLAGMLAATAAVIVATGQSPASIIILSLTVVATSLVALGTYRSLSPLVLPETVDAPAMVGGRTHAALEREKTLVLRSLKELEFDFAMGKVAKSDYDEVGGRLRGRAMGLMRQLDAGSYSSVIEEELERRLTKATSSRSHDAEDDADAGHGGDAGHHGDAGRQGVAGLKSRATGTSTSTGPSRTSAPVSVAPASSVARASPVARDFSPATASSPANTDTPAAVSACASCGVVNDDDARFCKNCGTRLAE